MILKVEKRLKNTIYGKNSKIHPKSNIFSERRNRKNEVFRNLPILTFKGSWMDEKIFSPKSNFLPDEGGGNLLPLMEFGGIEKFPVGFWK